MTDREMFTPPCGPVVGRRDGPVWRATGIPYARAARFALPETVPDQTAPTSALEAAPASPQLASATEPLLGSLTGGLARSEDCQNLSITVPEDLVAGELLPVMVWLHGGSNMYGAGDAPLYDATALVSEQRVVFVAVTHRLGVLGYLSGAGRPANLGLLDQIAAFQWVQRNIHAFGGDPARVTAFGQSAGGDAVAHLMATPHAERLFTRAIIQSAPLGISRGRSRMTAALDATGTPLDADSPLAEVLSQQALVVRAGRRFGLKGGMPLGTRYGQTPLPDEDQLEQAWNAVAPAIDLLIGTTAQETRLFLWALAVPRHLLSILPIGMLGSAISWLCTRVVYTSSARRFAERHRRAGGRAHRYRFTWAAPGNPFGAAHAIEIPFLFGQRGTWASVGLLEGSRWEDIDEKGRAVRQLWAAFARGEPLPPSGQVPGVLDFTAA